MNATQRREARKRINAAEHMRDCADESCIMCLRYCNTDMLVRVARDARLALEALEFVGQHRQTIPLEAWTDGGGI